MAIDVDTEFAFEGDVIEWRGPAPFFFVPVPAAASAEVEKLSRLVSYGWGVIPVKAVIKDVEFETSLFPRDGAYLLPLKVAVRRKVGLTLGDEATVRFRVAFSPPA